MRSPALPVPMLALLFLCAGCEDEIVRSSWTSFSVIEAEALDPDSLPVEGVGIRLYALGLDCNDLREGAVPGDSARTGADGLALLGVSIESGPLGDACLGVRVDAPTGYVLDGPQEREVPVRFVIRGQQPPGRLELLLFATAGGAAGH